jgi:hypothetical protein
MRASLRQQQARAGSCTSATEAMFESNDSTQECSVAQHDENDAGCPECGSSIAAVERRGPGDVTVRPCGHDVSDSLTRDFQAKRLSTDGGIPSTVEEAAEAARELFEAAPVHGDFDVSVHNTTAGESVTITPPPGAGLPDSVLSRLKTECALTPRNIFPKDAAQFTATFHYVPENGHGEDSGEEVGS